jgi:hypothetical protein
MLGVIDVSARERDPIADVWPRQMAVVARHELDHEIAALLGVVISHQHALVLAVEINEDVNIPVFLIADIIDGARDLAAGIANG